MIGKPLKTLVFILSVLLLSACGEKAKPLAETEQELDTISDFEHLLERGKLVAVTNCAAINYDTRESKPLGFGYELLTDFCRAYDLDLELLVNENLDSCFAMLDSCQVDVVAVCIGANREMKQRFLLTDPILMQKSVLVQRLPKGWSKMSTVNEVENQVLRSPIDLAGKTIHLPAGSHSVRLIDHLSDQIGDTIFVVVSDTLNSVDLIHAVHRGEIDFTVVEEYVARMASLSLGGLDTKLFISVEQPLSWAVSKQDADSSVLVAFNNWIDGIEQRHLSKVLAKYINRGSVFGRKPSPSGHLSEFDDIIKKTAKNIGWDWRLLASIIYQESHFRLDLESEKGAFGLMQLMPVVMERYGIDYDSTPEEQVEAGGKLLQYLENCLEKRVADSTERVKFVLAAYNAGLGHVYDAQRLASKYGKLPDVWDDNVDFFILNKSKAQYYNDTCCKAGYLRGTETFRFVEEVLERFYQYQTTYN